MSENLVTVEQAAERLRLHPKTVLRYIHSGLLPATRVGKSYRIVAARLDAFAGITSPPSGAMEEVCATCIVDIPSLAPERAERLATFLQSATLARDPLTPPVQLQTAFDTNTHNLKVVIIGSPSDASSLLELLQLQLRNHA